MKKYLLFLVVLVLSVPLFAQQPKVNLFLNDGTTKQLNLSDIEDLKFIIGSSACFIKIFYEDSLIENYQTKNIEKMKFETDANKFQVLNIYIDGSANSFKLADLDSINFFIAETPVPQIASINPTSGKIGIEVTLVGKNFGETQGTSIVSFKGKNAIDYKKWSDTLIKINVPAGATTGKVSVTVKGIKSNEVDFTIPSELLTLTPTSGKIGDIITIAGTAFGTVQAGSLITFNDTNATEYSSWSDNQIKVKVPKGAMSGNVNLIINGQKTNGLNFTVLPKFESITPSSGKIGDTVILAGSGFGILKDTSFVFFTGKKAVDYISKTTTEIKLKVPVGAKTGAVYISSGGNKSNELNFSIFPQITKIAPDSAGVADEVTITGTGFGDKAGASFVTFNDIKANEVTSWSDIKIVLKVPAGAVSGTVWINMSDIKSNEVKFTVIQHLLSVSPNALKIGDQMTITGTNFGANRETNTVLFNNITAINYDSWTDTEIKLKIPENVVSGKLYVLIGTKKSNPGDYSIIPEFFGISPTSGRLGNLVNITGKGFGDVQGSGYVSFTGGNATEILSWSNTAISLKVPASAKTGKVSVNASGQKSNELDFSILPTVFSILPYVGLPGDQVTLTGVSFGANRDASFVSFKNANAVSYTSWTDTEIKVILPVGAETGKVSVTVGTEKSNEVDFYLTPVISGISPNSGKIGDQVTISGSNFGATRGTSTMTFNTASVTTFNSWSNTSITVVVPVGTRTGKVSVVVNNIKSNEVDFTDTDIFYETVTIGTQEWMLKNLDSARYRNGDAIPQVTDATEWANLTTGAWCYYNNSSANNEPYGKLYNWYAVNDSRGIGPSGFHIPTDTELQTLIDYLGGGTIAGGKMKESGTSHWANPNTGATNESGFTAVGGGYRIGTGAFQQFNNAGSYWSRTEADTYNGYHRVMYYNNATIARYANGKVIGFSVRLIKD